MGHNINNSPVIIMGMHRSGTSAVSQMLEKCGLFLGKKKDPNQEALLFLALNEWMLWQGGASWDNPGPVRHLLENEEIKALVIDYITYILQSPRFISYLGLRKYVSYKVKGELPFPWGWKDPRNTILLPIWLSIFPEAKVIHVCRNGLEVARSLKIRSEKSRARKRRLYNRFRIFYWAVYRRKRFFAHSIRCLDMSEGLELWSQYMNWARVYLSSLKSDFIEIHYETMISQPKDTLRTLLEFCHLKCGAAKIEQASSIIKPRGIISADEQEAYQQMYRQYASRLREHGY